MALSPALKGQSMLLPDVKNYAKIPQVLDVPHLIQSQIQSWDWLKAEGLIEVYREISPIADYTGNKYELHFLEHYFRDPKYSPQESKEREITFSQPLYVKTRLVMKEAVDDEGTVAGHHGNVAHDDRQRYLHHQRR